MKWAPSTALASSIAAVTVALVLFLASLFALSLNLVHLRESFEWVQHTDDVLFLLAAIETHLIDAQSAERGYLLTGDADYVAPFARAQTGLDQQLDALQRLVADNAAQLQHVNELRQLVAARLSEFKQAIDLGPSRLQDALAIIRTAKEKGLTPAVRQRLQQLRQAELNLLRERQHRVERAVTLSSGLAIGAGILSLASAALGVFLFVRQRDQHRIRELQTELLHVSRVNTMGHTTSVMAHEIKQPLTAMRLYLQGVRSMLDAAHLTRPETIKETVDKTTAQVDRATEIIGRLRRFVERRETQRQAERLESVIDEAIALMAISTEQLTIRRKLPPGLPAVLVDRIELQQVLINLMRNAIEAMAYSVRRELTISGEMVASEGAVCVSVGDTGPGLAQSAADRLFQPFNSTKHDGMGVGLSICRTIVEGFGGRIWAGPNPGGGTIFHFTLPTVRARKAA